MAKNIVIMHSGVSIAPGTSWRWVGGKAPTVKRELEAAKRKRAAQVASIKVVVDGMTFDGDETAQSRKARAITAAETAGLQETTWVLADNTVAKVTKLQLQQALSKAMLAMGELWTTPYARAKA